MKSEKYHIWSVYRVDGGSYVSNRKSKSKLSVVPKRCGVKYDFIQESKKDMLHVKNVKTIYQKKHM